MKNKSIRLIACALALAMAASFAGCKKDEPEAASSEPVVSSQPVVSEPETDSDEPDIGEHKDYDKEDAPCYESGSIIVAEQDGKKRGMETYEMMLGTGCLEFYANELNQQKSSVSPKVKMYSMIVPTACELYCPANERYRIDSQEDIIKSVKDMLVGVEQVDVLPTLKNHNAEDIYYRTDSRWTPLGAYYAGKVFAKAAGVPYADISEYTKTTEKEYVGDLVELAGPQAYNDFKEQPDAFSYYAPKATFTTNYYDDEFGYAGVDKFYSENAESLQEGYYKGGFFCLRLDTKVNNDRKLLIVKDEYGTVLPTFLTSSFHEIYVVTYNYLAANMMEMIDEFGITDVLYLMNTYTVTDTRVYTLESLRTQATHGDLKDNAPDSDSDSDSDSDKKGSDSDKLGSDKDTDTVEYIYDVGINNQVGIVENSDNDAGQTEYGGDGYSDDNGGGNDYDDGGYTAEDDYTADDYGDGDYE